MKVKKDRLIAKLALELRKIERENVSYPVYRFREASRTFLKRKKR